MIKPDFSELALFAVIFSIFHLPLTVDRKAYFN